MKHFTTREVAKILDLTPERIRSCVRGGLLTPIRGPGQHLEFSFQDLLLLKTTKSLLDSRVPLKRIKRLLASLKRQLPDDQQLSSITIYADGRRAVAWDGNARWQPDSGQFLFNFDAQAVAEKVDLPVPPPPASAPTLTAAHWFNVASELETTSKEEARRAYHQALELDPSLSDAHVNLGRLYHEAKEHEKAEAHYRAAIQQSPHDAIAHFNLGVLLEDVRRHDEAVHAYRQAIAHDPEFADAHYNLGLLLESLGKKTEAIHHLRTARKLYPR
jgi:tetratricopeptide (TPR) repeat protein